MNRVAQLRKLYDEARSSSLQKNAADFPISNKERWVCECAHIAAFRQDDKPHLTWTNRIPTNRRDVMFQSCGDCALKVTGELEEMITHRRATLILNPEDTRTVARICENQGHKIRPVSDLGKRILSLMNA